MIKLSQRAWNNVIIISMLMLILLFNFSSNFLNEGSDAKPAVRALVPTDAVITTIEFHQHKIERIGQGWRATFADSANAKLSKLVEHWQLSEIRPIELDKNLSQFDPIDKQNVKLWFAGQTLPVEYQFRSIEGKTIVLIDGLTYQLIRPTLSMLTTPE
jgi:hypothetical protein